MNKKKKHRKTAIYTVVRVVGDTAVITPAVTSAKRLVRLKVYTSIPVQAGQHVQIGFATAKQIALDYLCLLVPLASAALVCLLFPVAARLLGTLFRSLAANAAPLPCGSLPPPSSMERLRAALVIISCMSTSIIMGAFARKNKNTNGNTLQVVKVVK